MDILSFWNSITANSLLFIAVLLTLGVILVNGWTDAPNAIATCVATRCMPPKAAIFMAAVCNFFGVLVVTLVNSTVAEKITKMVDFGPNKSQRLTALSAALVAIVLWATLAWMFGIPTSESHALIAGLTGSAVALHGSLRGVNSEEWISVVYGIVVSLVLGFGIGFLVCRGVATLFRGANRKKTDPFFKAAQVMGAASAAFMHGAQDGQKFIAVMLLCVYTSRGEPLPNNVEIPVWLMFVCSAVMALGTAMGGKKIIKSVGMDMVQLEKYQGFSADIATSISLAFCSNFGLPVSTTHVKTTAIMGVGAANRLSAINFGVVKEMLLTWVLTFPGCGLLAFLVTKIFML